MSDTIILNTGGNIKSASLAFERCGIDATLSRDPVQIAKAKRLVIPGQGRFGTVARYLQNKQLRDAVVESCKTKPVLAICVGMQLLFEKSEEDLSVEGIGLIKGTVKRFESGLRTPQMGWNTVEGNNWPIDLKGDYYLAHSYWCDVSCDTNVIAWMEYSGKRAAAVRVHDTIGVQFHPEKSGLQGEKIIKHFLEMKTC